MPINATENQDGRKYVWPPTGEIFPSVTTIISAINKPALMPWAAKQAAVCAVQHPNEWRGLAETDAIRYIADAHKRTASFSADIGTHVHECIEASIELEDAPNPTPEHMVHFEHWKTAFKPVFLMSEATVYNRTVGYAGTLDILAEIDGFTILIDVKTGKSIWNDVALQLAAYANGEFIGRHDKELPIPKIDGAAVLHLRMTGYRYVPVEIGPEVFTAFRHVNEVWRWMQYGSQHVLGEKGLLKK